MIEAFQKILQDVCVSALAAMAVFAALCFAAEMGRRAVANLPSVTLVVFLFVVSASSVIIGGGKTNGLLQAMLPFLPHVQQVQLPQVQPVVPPPVPRIVAPSPRASADMPFRARAWNRRGAWDDSFRCAFPGEWVFPHGTGHLDRVEVRSQGRILPRYGSTNVIADVGVPLQIVNPLTSFGCGPTASNSYVFAWTNAVVGRVSREAVANAETIDASIELFRNGDVAITTNGVTELRPRVLPFPRDGYGQDDEWVAANFTNATEILAVGYPQWVDAQVGEGLTNGLYKLTVTVPDDPPETTLLTVGDLSVAVTNAGDYVFLLGKGVRYNLSSSSDCAVDFLYAATDDTAETPCLCVPSPRLLGDGGEDGVWSHVSGELRLFSPFGHIVWNPTLTVSPSRWYPLRANATRSFTAELTDIPGFVSPVYAWSSDDETICSCEGSDGRTATFTCNFPAAYGGGVSLGLDVILNLTTLHVDYWRYIGYCSEDDDYEAVIADGAGCGLEPCVVVDASPAVVFFDSESQNMKSAEIGCFYMIYEPGTFELDISGDAVAVKNQDGAAVTSGYTWYTDGGVVGARHFLVERQVRSTSPSGTVFTVTFTPDRASDGLSESTSVTFVEVSVVAQATWPDNQIRRTLGVLEDANIYMSPMIQGLSLSCGGVVSENGTWCYDYTAPRNATTDVVENSDGACVCSLDVVAPYGYEAVITQVVDRATHECEAGAFEVFFKLALLPKTVSFSKIEVMEQGMTATNAVGYFSEEAHTNLLSHSHVQGAWSWTGIGPVGNEAGYDKAGVTELLAPWGVGGVMTWPIPNVYRGNGKPWNGELFCNTDQCITLRSDGTVWLEKFDRIVECNTNRQFNIFMRTSK